MLADLLEDNAALHAVYPMLDGADPRQGVRDAIAHLRALSQRSPHEETRRACAQVVKALDGLDGIAPEASTLRNEIARAEAAAGDPRTARDEREVLLARRALVRHRLNRLDAPGIPRIVHLIRTDSSDQDLPLVQYLCYRSVLAHCAGWRVMLHTPAIPAGPRWSRLLPHVETQVGAPPQWLGDRRLVAAAHQSDVWRLQRLAEHGGFYFDWDLLLLRSPESLRAQSCVRALERKEDGYEEVLGVSAIGAEPAAVFLRTWLDEMPAVFNPRKYVSHSILLAHRLANQLPALVRVLDYRSFYDPGWSEPAMRWLFDPSEMLPEPDLRERLAAAYGMHLFCSHANFLRRAPALTEAQVESPRCNLAVLLRPYL